MGSPGFGGLVEGRQSFQQGECIIIKHSCGSLEMVVDEGEVVELVDQQLQGAELYLLPELLEDRLSPRGKEGFLEGLLLLEPLLAPSHRLLELDHFVGDDLALLQRLLLGDQLVEGQPCTVQRFFNLSARFDGPLNLLPNRLGDFELILFGHFDEGVQLAEVNPRFD